MSHHHARLVMPLKAIKDGRLVYLDPSTPIRNVTLSNGRYYFDARSGGAWHVLATEEDLPAFTDKGRAQREAQSSRAAAADARELQRGRPTKSNAPATTTVSIRMTQSQKRELLEGCKKSDVTITDAVLGACVIAGLVTP